MNACLRRPAATLALAALIAVPTGASGQQDERGDIREFRVGLTVGQLPETGYVDFACGSDDSAPGRALAGWAEFGLCRADRHGLHEVRFDYGSSEVAFAQANDKWEGTKVSGHPVVLSLLFSAAGVVEGIRIVTDPAARRYLRKKAYLLSLQVKHRFSPETWRCVRHEPADDESPVGGVYLKERCENRLADRTVTLETDLYRKAGQGPEDFVNASRVEILSRERS